MKKDPSLRSQLRSYQRLMDISRDLASILEVDSLLDKIVHIAIELCSARAASILLFNENSRQLYFQTTTNLEKPMMRGINVPLEGSIAGWVVLNKQPVIIPDVHQDHRFFYRVEQATQFITTSLMAVPLITKGKVLGVLEVLNKEDGEFTLKDQEVMMVLGAQAAVAIENARLFQQSDLVADLVHELRTPLASISTAAYLLQRPEISEPQRTKLSATIHSEAQRLNEMASSFLDLAWLESGRAAFHPTLFDLYPLLEECRIVIQNKADHKKVHLSMNIPAELPLIEADRGKVKQVLLNLLSNAVKYNYPEGSVELSARIVNQEMHVCVADTGIGIPSESMPRLFERFFRVHGSERYADGTGLGLSICKQIIDAHRGRIKVQSIPGDGTTFSVFLPLRQPH
jgi:signal transduction histidine kinase